MRISRDEWGLLLAEITARRSTCLRRAVGCVLVNGFGHVLATGYNGVAAGVPHCNEMLIGEFDPSIGARPFSFLFACPGAESAVSGEGLAFCEAIHAEQNALMQCANVLTIDTVYVTVSPCVHCVKMLANTSAVRVVFRNRYAHDDAAKALWEKSSPGREWVEIPG